MHKYLGKDCTGLDKGQNNTPDFRKRLKSCSTVGVTVWDVDMGHDGKDTERYVSVVLGCEMEYCMEER